MTIFNSLRAGSLTCLTGFALSAGSSVYAATTNGEDNSNGEVNANQLPVKPVSASERQKNAQTADAVNRIPSVNVDPSELQPLADDKPIHGFHPIKKMLQPVERLEKNSTQLQQQIMKLEGPIAGLQPAMLSLHQKIGSVEHRMGGVQDRIQEVDSSVGTVGSKIGQVGSEIGSISSQMTNVRGDLARMQHEISDLNGPLKDLHKPLVEVAEPLKTVDQKLEKLAALLTSVLFTIVAAAVAITIGTPIAAILIYKYRRKLFPNMSDREFPVAKSGG
jgi:peptidoglycan hydrolase CwlO-like protein